ncbi:MAG: KH domain-containing protein [Armatimonadota bacterium]
MKELVEMLAKNLVDQPDKVDVREVEGTSTLTYEIMVAEDDVGKVIGKQGRIINAIRTIVKAAATKNGKKVYVEVIS